MNLYQRGLRDGALVNPKLFIFEKFNLGPHTNCWSNLVKRVKNLYYLVRVVTTSLRTCVVQLAIIWNQAQTLIDMDEPDLTRLQAKKSESSNIDVRMAIQSDHLGHQVGRKQVNHLGPPPQA